MVCLLIAAPQVENLKKLTQPLVDLLAEPEPNVPLLEHLSASHYEVLLIDLDTLSQISTTPVDDLRAVAPHLSIILVASLEQRSTAVQYLACGVDDYLLLPLDTVEVKVKIERVLEGQSSKSPVNPESGLGSLHRLDAAMQEIIQTLELDALLQIIPTEARNATQAELAKLFLTDQNGSLSEAPSPTAAKATAPHDRAMLTALVEQAALDQEVINRQLGDDQPPGGSALRSILVNPIVSRKKLIGVLALGSHRLAAFSGAHVYWLSVFCSQVAIAIENAYLFQNLSGAYINLAQSREKILQSRNTLQVIFDGISDALSILDQDLTVVMLNRVEAERQGADAQSLIGRSYLELAGSKNAPQLIEQIKAVLHSGKETTWISAKDESNPYLKDQEFRIYPIHNRLAQSERVVVFAHDISERRRWQASLFRSANLAAVGQLAGSVAHQINNPLTVTMTNSQLILLDTEPRSETYELAAGILKAGERIQNIITNLLGFSNQERYFFVQTDLVETIEGALALVIRSLKKAHIEIIKDYQVQPQLSASVSHLKLVWVNLLLNARDAVNQYAQTPRITIATRPFSEREVTVEITDNGMGISEQELEHLFRPFFSTKPIGTALGLGLYAAHAIVEHHRGQIRVSSQPGVATTFEVILPLDNPRDL
ncbi:MAG TPA: ATP-binding protein [Anaerolineae bacterium]|nr:ATP-binding protein [Anaerolineae bacterium]HMR64252.1 ATP-binding protein [Anaerolineae bacterium]